jgi:glycosyltransferase involved in cell wall biosynthesis
VKALVVTSHSDRPEAETFIGLARRGVDLRVLCSPAAPHFARLEQAGIDVAPFQIERRFDRAAVATLRRELETGRYALVHLFNNKAVSNGLRAAKGLPIKIVAYRGIAGNESFYNPMSWLRYLNPRVDRIVCVAEAVRRSLLDLRFFGCRLPPEKVVTIYKGHDLAWYTAEPLSRRELGLPEDAFLIGCVANWRPRKGIEVLVDACAALRECNNAYLLLVGHMDAAPLRERIERSPLRDRIRLLGYRKDAPRIVAACDVAVLPSLRREGLPKTVIEAMAYGVAPVVTNVGGSAELVEDRRSGLVVAPGDARALGAALVEFYEHPDERRAFGDAARSRIAECFSIDRTIEQTYELYRELAAQRGREALRADAK